MSETNLLLHPNSDCLCGISIVSKVYFDTLGLNEFLITLFLYIKLYSQKYSLICSHMGYCTKTNIYFVNH
ncbi:hypothetical protein HanRHA438_Chr14g0636891 [Helianthus annuus]|nr:hypothetical protein HanIR_Chr14g0678691 [Helianthus annuus]KAJ0852331.1 hypothetical protein HanRHA438_Chr14g0636891 [Helianthus annuus]